MSVIHLAEQAEIRVSGQPFRGLGRLDETDAITWGEPAVARVGALAGQDQREALRLAAAVGHASKHPLAQTVLVQGSFSIETGAPAAASLRVGGVLKKIATPPASQAKFVLTRVLA
jgi:hypothetical protein